MVGHAVQVDYVNAAFPFIWNTLRVLLINVEWQKYQSLWYRTGRNTTRVEEFVGERLLQCSKVVASVTAARAARPAAATCRSARR